MKKTGIKIFAYIAIVLMLASPVVALGDSDSIKEKVQDRDMVNATADAPHSQISNRTELATGTQERQQNATENFLRIKASNSALNTEEAIEAAKEYLNSTINLMVESLDNEEYIEKLNAEKEDVAAATTRAELAESARDIREIWIDARTERTNARANSINNKLTAVIKTSEAMSLRLENEIARMEQNGENVTKLNEMLEEYNAYIQEAKEYQTQARNAYTNGNENGEVVRNMNLAGQSIRAANAVLGDMLTELKQYREGLVVLSEDETVTAEGNGTVVISGNFSLNFNATDVLLVVKDMSEDTPAQIKTENASYVSSNADSGNSDDNNRAFVYHNLTGDATIEGTRLTVMLRGTDINLDVEGTGNVVFTGDGTYEADGVESEWAAPVTDVETSESEEQTSD